MRVKLFFLLIAISMHASLNAQISNNTLKGIVTDTNNTPIAYATITLLDKQDSIISGGVTGTEGDYAFKVPPGTYTLRVSAIGYSTYNKNIEINSSQIYPQIKLNEGINLDQIVITASKPLITSEKGNIVCNVANSQLSRLPSGMDVLAFVPGIHISGNNIMVIGKGKPLILINGKEVKQESEIANLRPEMIKKITVDRNPSAQYNAEYQSIIHILTKNDMADHLTAQVIQGSAFNKNYNHSETMNLIYNSEKIKKHLSYKFKDSRNTDIAESFQNLVYGGDFQNNSYKSRMKENIKSHNLTFGSNIATRKKDNLDIQYFLDYDVQKGKVNGTENIKDNLQNIEFDVKRIGQTRSYSHTANISYNMYIDDNSSLNFYGDYTYKHNNSLEDVNSIFDTSNIKYTNLKNWSRFNVTVIRAEYQKQINKYAFSSGLRYSSIDSQAKSDIQNSSDRSDMREENIAAYGVFSTHFSKFTLEAGARLELNKGKYFNNNIPIYDKPKYMFNIFPSLTVNYDKDENLQLNLNYTSKVKRPGFYELDPTVNYLSSVLYEHGTPSLKPTLNHTIEVNGTAWKKLSISIGYVLTKNLVAYVMEPNKDNILYNSPTNIHKAQSIYLNATYNLSIGRFNSNIVADLKKTFIKFNYRDQEISNDKPQIQLVSINTYLVNPTTFLFCNFMGSNKYSYINTVFSPTYSLTAGVNLRLLNGKIDLMIFGNDILHKANGKTNSKYGYVENGQIANLDSRMFGMTVKFNFNNFKGKFKKSTSNQTEIERISR
ncbi:outer membrane beta-barrel family protein [Bacteroides sp.]|uniref:outer membrane beta-barrel family protein n=1 Tax=Bacteroides sp. TaxID=29523 RepID=UPI0026060279|nr:outer membrane beta-barrel family protein [Bacteroides sp.]